MECLACSAQSGAMRCVPLENGTQEGVLQAAHQASRGSLQQQGRGWVVTCCMAMSGVQTQSQSKQQCSWCPHREAGGMFGQTILLLPSIGQRMLQSKKGSRGQVRSFCDAQLGRGSVARSRSHWGPCLGSFHIPYTPGARCGLAHPANCQQRLGRCRHRQLIDDQTCRLMHAVYCPEYCVSGLRQCQQALATQGAACRSARVPLCLVARLCFCLHKGLAGNCSLQGGILSLGDSLGAAGKKPSHCLCSP